MNPLVTCLCLTKDRRHFLPRAIECFLKQRYEAREMVIVADRREDIEGLIPEQEWPFIQVVYEPNVIGAKRNAGCAVARGEVILHWDDDDVSAPGRIRNQVDGLWWGVLSVGAYHSMKFTDGKSWWQYSGARAGFGFGNSLCYTSEWWKRNRFREIQQGEDNAFIHRALQRKQFVSMPNPDMLYATMHAGNTAGADPARNPSLVLLPNFEWSHQ
jgi:glycosyltransferase involved in cell wall biosynthesis